MEPTTYRKHQLTDPGLLKTSLGYGLIGCGIYAAYFLLMRLIGLGEVIELRFFNYIIMCVISFYALKKATTLNDRQPRFLMEMAIVFLTCASSFVLFGIFIFFYSLLDPFIVNLFNSLFPGALAFGHFSAPVFIASEGLGLGAIVALGMTFFFRSYRDKIREKSTIGQPEII